MFKYRETLEAGPPRHAPGDAFSRRHPPMDLGRRAKIFAPFDALRGFSAAIIARQGESFREGEEEEEEMCCRYYIEHDDPEIMHVLENANRSPLVSRFLKAGDALITDGEIHPTAVVPTIASGRDGKPGVFPMKWGFTIPGIRPLFNARVETASVRQSFRDAWEQHRCIIPASWYYEWKHEKTAGGKSRIGDKYAIQPKGGRAAWLCGLYRLEDSLPHFVILTRGPTEDLASIHDRMPLIMPGNHVNDWVNPLTAPEKMLPFAVTDLIAESVSSRHESGWDSPNQG